MVWVVSLLTTNLSTRRLTAAPVHSGIRSLIWFGKPRPPSHFSALPPLFRWGNAAPRCISERTSYLCVRLAFHPYPHLIPQFCNTGGFEPPPAVRQASLWTWVAHTVSGLPPLTPFPCEKDF